MEPDEDWLDLYTGAIYNTGFVDGQNYAEDEKQDWEFVARAKAAINAKTTELLVAELENIAVKLIKAVGGANYITNIPIERIIELQASQPINLNESEM
jgi:hypothetical protein